MRFSFSNFSKIVIAGISMIGLTSCLTASSTPSPPSASLGNVVNLNLSSIDNISLVNQSDKTVTLSDFKGKYVVLAPFLTLCGEECPMTTGAFIALHQDVVAAGLGNKVVFIEMTVDPRRDTPARLAAYSSRFGANWTLLTSSASNLAKVWKKLGVWYQVVPEGKPAQIDWWTGKPLTYDVAHSDGYFLIAPNGNERFVTISMANLHGKLSPKLKGLLDPQGIKNLDDPQGPTWTVSSALSSISWLIGKNIPAAAST